MKEKVTWHSQFLSSDINVQAVLPQGNVTDAVFLVGHMSNEWFDETNVAEVVEGSAIALVAVDDLGSWGGINRPADKFFYEDFIREELLKNTRDSFGIDMASVRRHIAGFSKGSYLAMRMGLSFADQFQHIISCSGGSADAYGMFYDMEKFIPGIVKQMFPGVTTAREFDLSNYNMENFVRNMAAQGKLFPAIDMYCGNDDVIARAANVRLDGVLSELGVEHTFTMVDGPHGWDNAQKELTAALEKIKNL